MEQQKIIHFLMVPFTGLGLFLGYRGRRWLRNRIQIFEQFVLPSLFAQTNKDFTLWIAWRYEERSNPIVQEFMSRLNKIQEFKVVATWAGCPFWDDKYPDAIARIRLIEAVHGSLGELINIMGEADYVLMTIQPSDDCYHKEMVEQIQAAFGKMPKIQALGFKKGYVMDYKKKELAEWNPTTIPPFFTIKFPREIFIDPLKHIEFIGLKYDIMEEKNEFGYKIKYKRGTPYPSHEYLKDVFGDKFGIIQERGFIVGVHGENISTVFNHPFTGQKFSSEERNEILKNFGLASVEPLMLKISLRKMLMRKLPHEWQKKLRYWFGERFVAKVYDFLRA